MHEYTSDLAKLLDLEKLPAWNVTGYKSQTFVAREDFDGPASRSAAKELVSDYSFLCSKVKATMKEPVPMPLLIHCNDLVRKHNFLVYQFGDSHHERTPTTNPHSPADPYKTKMKARPPEGWPTHRAQTTTEKLKNNLGWVMGRKALDTYVRRLAEILGVQVDSGNGEIWHYVKGQLIQCGEEGLAPTNKPKEEIKKGLFGRPLKKSKIE